MPTQRIVDGRSSSPQSLAASPATPVAQRSARRATARRASSRRAAARQRKDDVERRIIEYLQDSPQSTTGEIAKGLNADRGVIAAGRSHIARAGQSTADRVAD
jgi:hypothetical protein